MALVYTEEQQLLRDSIREFLAERASVGQFRALRDSGDQRGFDPVVWSEMAELGWAGMLVPEAHDGLDFGCIGAAIALEEMGRHLSQSPFFATAVVGAGLLVHSQSHHLLPAVVDGQHLLALALDEGPHHQPEATAMIAKKDGAAYLLSGQKQFVLDGAVADSYIVVARTGGEPGEPKGLSLFLVPRDSKGVTCVQTHLLDHRNCAALHFERVRCNTLLGNPGEGMDLLQPTLDVACACLAAEMLGIAQEAFTRTVAYLKERKQFGIPIGAFQALQHRAAHLFSEIELGKSIVLKALQSLESGDAAASALASAAKAKCCDIVALAGNEAIQMHGGIGMTDEFDMGFFIKRGRAARATYGDQSYHANRFARLSSY